jgi:hypothetical protein
LVDAVYSSDPNAALFGGTERVSGFPIGEFGPRADGDVLDLRRNPFPAPTG